MLALSQHELSQVVRHEIYNARGDEKAMYRDDDETVGLRLSGRKRSRGSELGKCQCVPSSVCTYRERSGLGTLNISEIPSGWTTKALAASARRGLARVSHDRGLKV